MDDKRYNNDGTPVGENADTHVQQEVQQDIQQAVQQNVHVAPAYGMAPPYGAKRRKPWIPLALVLIFLGGLMFGTAWLTGSRGGNIYFRDGRLQVRAYNRRDTNRMDVALPSGAANAHTIIIDTRSTNVRILPTNGAMALAVYGDVEQNVRYNNGTLYIETPAQFIQGLQIFGGSFNRREVVLYLPRNTNVLVIDITASTGNITVESYNGRNLSVNLTSGNIRLRDIDIIHANLQTRTGNITVDNLTANTLAANSTSGNVRINDSTTIGTTISLSTGNIHINGGTHTHVETNSTSGNVTINTDVYTNGSTRIETRTGNVRLTLRGADTTLRGIRNYHSLQARTGTVRINGQRLGNTSINEGDTNFDVHVCTTAGNIHVDYR